MVCGKANSGLSEDFDPFKRKPLSRQTNHSIRSIHARKNTKNTQHLKISNLESCS